MKYKINIGGGLKRYPSFVNLDMDPLCNPDYLCNISKDELPFEDNSVDEVYAFHILEHIGGDGFFHLIKELYRVCDDGAIIHVEVPHHRHDEMYGDPTHCRMFTVDTFRLFSKKYNQWHIDHFGSSTGFGMKCNVDFEVIEYDHIFDPDFIPLLQQMEDKQRELFIKSSWNVIKYLQVKLQVIKDKG
jgi:hypothetical protein